MPFYCEFQRSIKSLLFITLFVIATVINNTQKLSIFIAIQKYQIKMRNLLVKIDRI